MRKDCAPLVALSFAILYTVLQVFSAFSIKAFVTYYDGRELVKEIAFDPCVLEFIESTTVSYKGSTKSTLPTDRARTGTIRKSVNATADEIELLARMVWCEAGLEPFEGMCMVVDTVLNRVKDTRFPNTITDVLYAPGQYSTVLTRKFKTCTPTDACYEAVRKEMLERSNTEVLYFGRTPITHNNVINVGHHYFSN